MAARPFSGLKVKISITNGQAFATLVFDSDYFQVANGKDWQRL